MKYRLNRAIAATGYCSRRKADELIAQGRVKVNDKLTTDFSFEVDPDLDDLQVDGQNISVKKFEYILMYKPPGIVTTCEDEYGRRNVIDLLPVEVRHVRPVGRLDLDSEGLLILTNDGELAQGLAHPSNHVFKRYEVTVSGDITSAALARMASGIELEEGKTLPAKVRLIKKAGRNSRFEISIREGRNRQIRRMCAALGYPVVRLVRVAIGALQLRQLKPGEWRRLTAEELQSLRAK
ncbi:MAG TPA: pseudouridine synthase [Planktothrix sp.]|jgi:pseudouridine synthase